VNQSVAFDEEILAPHELLRGALNICRAVELADRDNDDRIADDCLAMLMQHLHMARVVMVHSDLLLARNIERAAEEVLREAREEGHISQYLYEPETAVVTAEEPHEPVRTRLAQGHRAAAACFDRAGRIRGRTFRARSPRSGAGSIARPSRPPHSV